jgi:2-polyprenyl-6-methoxyphenol hydroxylase-like FAD-dependent oxidoreductase
MTTGAAQTLVRAYKVSPGQKVVIAGNGPLNLQLACEMVRAGVQVQALLEQAPMPAASQWRELARAVWHGPDLMFEGLRYLAELKRHGVQVLWSHRCWRPRGKARCSRW